MDREKDIEEELMKEQYRSYQFDGRNAIRLSRAILLNPKSKDTEAYRRWAESFSSRERFQEQGKKYLTAIQINPSEGENYIKYGNWLLNQGRLEEAVAKYQAVNEFDDLTGYGNYGRALIDLERFEEFEKLDTPEYLPFSWGKHMLKNGKTKEAEVLYRKTIEQDPNSLDVYAEWAETFQECEYYQQAVDNYKMFHKLGGDLTYYSGWYGVDNQNLYASYGLALYYLKRYQEVDELYQEAITPENNKYDPDYPRNRNLYEYWGEYLYKKGEYEGAEIMLSKATQINPHVENYFLWGDVLQAQNKSLEAQEKYAKAEEMDPQNEGFGISDLRLDWGVRMLENGKTKMAEVFYRKSIKQHPWDANLYVIWAGKFENYEHYEQALDIYKTGQELNPRNLDVHVAIGQLLSKMKRFEEALDAYLKAIKINFDNTTLYKHLADFLKQTNLVSKGTNSLLRIFDSDSNCSKTSGLYTNWGAELSKRGEYKEAEVAFSKANQVTPNSSNYILWGDALQDQNKFLEAQEKYAKAAILDPQNRYVYHRWGYALLAVGNYQEAVKKYAKSIELDPSDVDVHITLGQLLVKLRRFKEAIDVYRKAIGVDISNEKAYMHLADLLAQIRLSSKDRDILLEMYAQNSPVLLNGSTILIERLYLNDKEPEKSYDQEGRVDVDRSSHPFEAREEFRSAVGPKKRKTGESKMPEDLKKFKF